ncbi:DNA-binding protein, putative [hydrothermal vent metagenome]|jgi:transcriptional regulator with XRE-family HTH domain|uniref:DNA-binding protein, putative n=4 Tax=root TaxID=1 RepID=A0A160U0R9_9ZZZZ|tara:strand:+ start:18506 stop:18805 length:300 start_codon:yes stop_codon:yes gene_type:complete
MTQEALSEKLGLTFQQVQKYEAGRSRLSAGRLRDVAIALGKPINYFYEPFPAAPEVRDLEHAKIGLLKREAKKLVDSLVRADDLETAIQILAALGPSRP